MKNSLIFTAADFKNPDGDAASPEGAAIIANDRSAKVLACLGELRKIIFSETECHCCKFTSYFVEPCARCKAIKNIDKMTNVVEGES